jgi:hypothetical protein
VVILLLLIVSLSASLFDSTVSGNPDPSVWWGEKPLYYNVTIASPDKQIFVRDNESVVLKFIGQSNNDLQRMAYCYTFDGSGERLMGAIWSSFPKVNEKVVSKTVISNDSLAPDKPYNPYVEITTECTATLPPLTYGLHNVTIYHGNSYNHEWNLYNNLKTFYFTVFEPLNVSILSPQNETYSNIVPLDFSSNRQIGWSSYSLDGRENVTVSGNTTLTQIPTGLHNVTVYANDTFGNVAVPQTISFIVAQRNPNPTDILIAPLGVAIIAVIVVFGLLFYRRHRRLSKQ